MSLAELQLLGVLDRDDAFTGRMNDESTFNIVVLPVPEPPETMMFALPCTQRGAGPDLRMRSEVDQVSG